MVHRHRREMGAGTLLRAGMVVLLEIGCNGLVANSAKQLSLRSNMPPSGIHTDGRLSLQQSHFDVKLAQAAPSLPAAKPLMPLRGGAGVGKKLGAKNIGLLLVALSILLTPSAMSSCSARYVQQTPKKLQRMGCGPWFMFNNVVTLTGLALVLVNSRKFDRYGRSKFKMRLTGSVIIFMGMMLVIAHAETSRLSWYSRTNVYLGLMLEWWGFASLFYNFTPKFLAQIPREFSKLFNKGLAKAGMAPPANPGWTDPSQQQREIDRLNRWAEAQSEVPGPPPPDAA